MIGMALKPTLEHASTQRLCAAAAGVLLALGPRLSAAQQDSTNTNPEQKPSTYSIYVADQVAYDDNLFRLPSGADVETLVGPGARRQDLINSASLGTEDHWYTSNQTVDVNLRVDTNRYVDNDALNNVSGKGHVAWDWRLGQDLSGQAGVEYYRGLISFTDTNYYGLDMVGRADYFANARYQVGPHWAVLGGFTGADTSLSAAQEKIYDFNSKAGNAGVEYASASGNTLTLDYRYTDARFPQVFVLNGAPFNSDYNEDTTRLLLKYAFSAAIELDASAGYLKRDYPDSQFAAFSGDIWRASLQWQPTDEWQFVLAGWRELKAYVDSESDYFVSKGGSIGPSWKASDILTLSFLLSKESHDYIGSSPSALTLASRHDNLTTGQARVDYKPTDSLAVTLMYNYNRRDSNHTELDFGDTLASLSVTYKFQL